MRIDDTGFGGIKVIQEEGFGYGIDSVLLAAFAAGETGAKGLTQGFRIADLGTDCGIVAFIVAHKIPGVLITGIEFREDAVRRAERACKMNGFEDNFTFIVSDVLDIQGRHDYDAVITNPPYFKRSVDISPRTGGGISRTDARYIARHETTADIFDFTAAAASMLRKGGSLYMVHRPDRLPDIFEAMRKSGIEPKEMQLVAPSEGRASNIVLIHGIRGAGCELRMLPELTVYDGNREYTEEIMRLYERNQ